MNLVQKIAPKGVDLTIDYIQEHLNTMLSWSNVTIYPRIYKEETETGIKPKVYNTDGDYEEVFYNDTLNGSMFFYTEDSRTVRDETYPISLSLVVQMNLNAIYPTITHRADEEAHNDLILALNQMSLHKVNGLVTGIRNVYSEFEVNQVLLDDINEYHCFRIDMEVWVSHKC